jgi:hypothetical protein
LTSITIPNSVTSIGIAAFDNSALESIIIPESVSCIEERAFSDCQSLKTIKIPNGIETIEWQMFYYCPELKSVVIPESVVAIKEEAFRFCNSLEVILCFAINPPTLEEDVFLDVPLKDVKLLVPLEAAEAYKAAEGWKEFGAIIPMP